MLVHRWEGLSFLRWHRSGLLIYSTCLKRFLRPYRARGGWPLDEASLAQSGAKAVQVTPGDLFHREAYWGLIKLQCVWEQWGPNPWGGLNLSWPISEALKHSNGCIPNSSLGQCLLLRWFEWLITSTVVSTPQYTPHMLHDLRTNRPTPALWWQTRLNVIWLSCSHRNTHWIKPWILNYTHNYNYWVIVFGQF